MKPQFEAASNFYKSHIFKKRFQTIPFFFFLRKKELVWITVSKYAKNLYFVWLKGNFQNSEPKLQNLARKLLELKKGAMNGMLQLARLNEPHSLGCFYLIYLPQCYPEKELTLKPVLETLSFSVNTNLAFLKSWEALWLRKKAYNALNFGYSVWSHESNVG